MNKPAFPLKEAGVNENLTGITDNEGMSLLEYYAGQALQGLCVRANFEEFAKACFKQAEAMIREAEKRK